MTEQQALSAADAARQAHEIAPGWRALRAERRLIELAEGAAGEAAPVRDLLAWVVRLGAGVSWVELALDDRTGQVVRVERSR